MTYKYIAALIIACFLATIFFTCPDFIYAQSEKNAYWDNKKVRERIEYDNQDNVVSKTFFREDGSLEKFEKYDTDGNQTEESYYGDGGKLCGNPVDYWAAIKRTYQNGNLTSDTTYSATGQMIERRIYDGSGDLVDRQYVGDDAANPDEEYTPPLELSGRTDQFYDSNGKEEYQTSAYKDIW